MKARKKSPHRANCLKNLRLSLQEEPNREKHLSHRSLSSGTPVECPHHEPSVYLLGIPLLPERRGDSELETLLNEPNPRKAQLLFQSLEYLSHNAHGAKPVKMTSFEHVGAYFSGCGPFLLRRGFDCRLQHHSPTRSVWKILLICLLLGRFSPLAIAQSNQAGQHSSDRAKASSSSPPPDGFVGDIKKVTKHFVFDQKFIWTSPSRLNLSDAEWLVPIGGITTGLIVTDPRISHEATRNSHTQESVTFSNVGVALLGATSASMYFMGLGNQDGKLRETGLLSAEAAANALAVDEVLKYSFRRERPATGNGQGSFFQSGGTSFPSAHAATSFAIATVIANEYPGILTQFLAYGLATGVSVARVTGQQHFPSDVFIGGTLGYLIGRSTFRNHHDPELNYGTFERAEQPIAAERMSSTYIELDSWIYPAIERLAALGVINSTYFGLRPWTRVSVYQMLARAEDSHLSPEATRLLEALRLEFSRESELRAGTPNKSISIDSLYERTQYIAGNPLNDGFHFGQTIVNDFGRPYGEGLQQIAGFETRAESGRFSFFVRGEYQRSPSVPGYSQQVNQTLATIDGIPGFAFNGEPSHNYFRLLDTYASFNLLSNEISVGKQSYWWGATDSSALMLSNNAAPFYGLRISRTLPLYIPWVSKLFGMVRYDNFFGRLYGDKFPPDPFTFGQKFSMHPTENLELGFSRSSIFAGKDLEPLTFGTFKTAFTSTSSGTNPGFNPRFTPGARHANFDFRYRLPFVREWASVYADSFVHDDVSPIDAPNRAALLFGLYLARVPKIPKLDLHIEGGETDSFAQQSEGGNFYYSEFLYKDSYVINRNLMGSWLGREGTGGQAWATYWLNPKSSVILGFRDVKVSHFFIPQGETQQDAYGILNYQWQNGFGLHLMAQQERWVAPFLVAGPQHNFTTQIQLSYGPKDWKMQQH